MQVQRQVIPITCDSGGAATVYSDVVTGRVVGAIYTKNNFSNGVTLTLTANETGEPIVVITSNSSAVIYPRVGVHDATGAAATTDGTRLLRDAVHLAADRVKCVVAGGGNGGLGTLTLIFA